MTTPTRCALAVDDREALMGRAGGARWRSRRGRSSQRSPALRVTTARVATSATRTCSRKSAAYSLTTRAAAARDLLGHDRVCASTGTTRGTPRCTRRAAAGGRSAGASSRTRRRPTRAARATRPRTCAAMPTSAATRRSIPASGSAQAASAPRAAPRPPPIVKSGASVPPDVPLPSESAHETNLSDAEDEHRLARRGRPEDAVDVVVADAHRVRREDRRRTPTTTPPIAGHHIQWMGSFSNASSTRVDGARDEHRDDADDDADRDVDRERRAAGRRRRSGIAKAGRRADERHARAAARPRSRARPG